MTFAVGIMCGEGVVIAADTLTELLPNDETAVPGTGKFVPGGTKIRETARGFVTGYGVGQLLSVVDDLILTLPVIEPDVIRLAVTELKASYRAPRHILDKTGWIYSYEGGYSTNPALGAMVRSLDVGVALFQEDGSVSLKPTPAYACWPHGIPDALYTMVYDYLAQFGRSGDRIDKVSEVILEVFRALQVPGINVSNDLYIATHRPIQRRSVEHVVIGRSPG